MRYDGPLLIDRMRSYHGVAHAASHGRSPRGAASRRRRGGGTTRGLRAGDFPFLQLAGSLGHTGAAFLIAANFASLFAPLFYFTNLAAFVDPRDPSAVAVLLFSDPSRLFAVGDLLLLIGAFMMSGAGAFVLLGLPRLSRKVPIDAFILGGASVGGLVAWSVATVLARGGARSGLDAVAAVGGWSNAALLLLVASVLYVAFTVRVDPGAARRGFAPIRWPVFAAINLAGTAALRPTGGRADEPLAIVGLGLVIVLLPLLGIVTYRDVMESFDKWPKRALATTRSGSGAVELGRPPPPVD